MTQAILVPLDGSALAEQALPLAADLARRAGATLHLVHVQTPGTVISIEGQPVIDSELHSLAHEHAATYLAAQRERVLADGDLAVTTTVRGGTVAASLIDYATSADIELVVLTTHGHGGLARFWLGSVADELIHHLTTPVLLVRPGVVSRAAAPAIGRLLVPLDGSTLAERALEPALRLSRLLAVPLTLLRVIEPSVPVNAALRLQDKAARGELTAVASRLEAAGVTVETRLRHEHSAANGILKEARRQPPALIALTTHGRRGLGRLLLGSVADKVIRAATVPVLIWRPPSSPADERP